MPKGVDSEQGECDSANGLVATPSRPCRRSRRRRHGRRRALPIKEHVDAVRTHFSLQEVLQSILNSKLTRIQNRFFSPIFLKMAFSKNLVSNFFFFSSDPFLSECILSTFVRLIVYYFSKTRFPIKRARLIFNFIGIRTYSPNWIV